MMNTMYRDSGTAQMHILHDYAIPTVTRSGVLPTVMSLCTCISRSVTRLSSDVVAPIADFQQLWAQLNDI